MWTDAAEDTICNGHGQALMCLAWHAPERKTNENSIESATACAESASAFFAGELLQPEQVLENRRAASPAAPSFYHHKYCPDFLQQKSVK